MKSPAQTSRRTSAAHRETEWLRNRSFRILLRLQRLLMQPRVRRRNESLEQRMWLVRFTVEFRMKLARDEKWMLRQLNHLDELPVRRQAAKGEAAFLETFPVGVVEFVTMPMPFIHHERAIKLLRLGAHHELARLRAQAHGAAFLGHA